MWVEMINFVVDLEIIGQNATNMKKASILTLAVAALGLFSCSGNTVKYNVTGVNAPEDGASVYLVDALSSQPIDSAVVAGGTFQMKGKADKDSVRAENYFFFL